LYIGNILLVVITVGKIDSKKRDTSKIRRRFVPEYKFGANT